LGKAITYNYFARTGILDFGLAAGLEFESTHSAPSLVAAVARAAVNQPAKEKEGGPSFVPHFTARIP
jgi:hypothetical protein